MMPLNIESLKQMFQSECSQADLHAPIFFLFGQLKKLSHYFKIGSFTCIKTQFLDFWLPLKTQNTCQHWVYVSTGNNQPGGSDRSPGDKVVVVIIHYCLLDTEVAKQLPSVIAPVSFLLTVKKQIIVSIPLFQSERLTYKEM